MDHKWGNELATRFGSVDVCEVCHVMKIRPKTGPSKYFGKEGESSEAPACKSAEDRQRAFVAAR